MFPHERSLVKDMQDEPFVLLGVNGDFDMEALRKQNAEQQISWRSFQNQHESYEQPIADAWNVQGWPTLYLIDAEGKIRHRWLGNPGDKVLDQAIAKLVTEAKEGQPQGTN